MLVLAVSTIIVMVALGCLGLFMSGLAAMRQVRLSRHRSNLRLVSKLRARQRQSHNNLQQNGRFQ